MTAPPCDGVPTEMMVRVSPSGSESLSRTSMTVGTSTTALSVSSTASGGSPTGVMVTSTAWSSESLKPAPWPPPESVTVKVKESAPL